MPFISIGKKILGSSTVRNWGKEKLGIGGSGASDQDKSLTNQAMSILYGLGLNASIVAHDAKNAQWYMQLAQMAQSDPKKVIPIINNAVNTIPGDRGEHANITGRIYSSSSRQAQTIVQRVNQAKSQGIGGLSMDQIGKFGMVGAIATLLFFVK